jgi:phosphate/sulfate permease
MVNHSFDKISSKIVAVLIVSPLVAFCAALFFFWRKHSRIFVQNENLENDGTPASSIDRRDKPIKGVTVTVGKGSPVDSVPQSVVFNRPMPLMLEQVPQFKGITFEQNVLRTQGDQINSSQSKFAKGTVTVLADKSPGSRLKTESISATHHS